MNRAFPDKVSFSASLCTFLRIDYLFYNQWKIPLTKMFHIIIVIHYEIMVQYSTITGIFPFIRMIRRPYNSIFD
jgi:hypothetical protein